MINELRIERLSRFQIASNESFSSMNIWQELFLISFIYSIWIAMLMVMHCVFVALCEIDTEIERKKEKKQPTTIWPMCVAKVRMLFSDSKHKQQQNTKFVMWFSVWCLFFSFFLTLSIYSQSSFIAMTNANAPIYMQSMPAIERTL